MFKFRRGKEKNCLCKYMVNKPKIEAQRPPQSLTHKTEPLAQHKQPSSSLIKTIYRSFRQSEKSKPNQAQAISRSFRKHSKQQLKRNETQPCNSTRYKQIKTYLRSITKKPRVIEQRVTHQVERDRDEKREENKKMMLRHMSFSQTEEDKINEQKEYLRKLKEFKGNKSKVMMETYKLYDMQLRKHQQKIIQSFKTVEKIYLVLQDMKELGYHIKTNKYLIFFCTEVKSWLIRIFLQPSKDKKDAFLPKVKYFVLTSCITAKRNLSTLIGGENNTDLSAIINDLTQLLNHMENSLRHKKKLEILEVQNYVESRMKQRKNNSKPTWGDLRISKYKHQEFDFSEHLAQLEDRYGPMREITKVSRCRFVDLNKTFERLQTLL